MTFPTLWRAQGVVPEEDTQRVQMSTQEKLSKGRREVRHGGNACKYSPWGDEEDGDWSLGVGDLSVY